MTEADSKTSETSTEEVAPAESKTTSPPKAETPAGTDPQGDTNAGADAATDTNAAAVAATLSGEEAAAEAHADTVSGTAAPGKKKRRRRRKKKGASSGETPRDSKASHHHAPFLHLFEGAARKHAFSVGEVIAGRVERVDDGAIIADLFGKAIAIADVDEPREVPIVIHEQEQATTAASEAAPGDDAAAASGTAASPDASAATVAAAGASAAAATPADPATLTAAGQTVSAVVSDWALESTEVTDLPDDDFAEADTVVAAPAFDPTDASQEAAAVTDPAPPAETASGVDASSAAKPTPTPGSEAAPAQQSEGGSEPSTPEPSSEPEDLSDADLSLLEPLPTQEPPQVGAIFRGRIGAVAESGHIAIVNRIVDKAAVRKAIRAARAQHRRVQGVIYGFNRGGFDVMVGGIRAFCPASAMSLTPIEDPSAFVGQRCEFSLPQDKGGKKSIIVSRRNILEKEARKRARERMEELEVGAKLKGKVTEVRDYGVLVDLGGGLDGLVHMSEVSWGRGVRPQDAAKVGDEVDVEVIKLQPATRKDRYGRVSLSMRACQPDPWDAAKDTLRPGAPIKGKVVRTTDFGAFIEIQENIEGLLHISELGGSKELTHAKQAVSEGDEIDVVIERVDKEQRRISLSKLSEADAKAIEAGEIEFGKAPRSLKPGSHVAVVIKRMEHGGAQVQVDGMLGKRGRGFIPNRELQDARGDKRKALSQGDLVEVKVIGTERDGTLRCSIRARLLDEERKAVREYRKESAKQGLGTFGDLLKAKLEGGSE